MRDDAGRCGTMRDGTLVRCRRDVNPRSRWSCRAGRGRGHRRPQREIPRSLQGRRGVTAPSRCRAVSGVTHGRAARRARALMRSDRPCGRPAPCRFTVVSGGRGQRLPAWQARCNPRRTPAAAPGDRATAATELRKLSHAVLGARPDSPFPIRWAGRHRRA